MTQAPVHARRREQKLASETMEMPSQTWLVGIMFGKSKSTRCQSYPVKTECEYLKIDVIEIK